MGIRGHRDTFALPDEGEDGAGGDVGLAGAGRALHGQNCVVHGGRGGLEGGDRVGLIGNGQGGRPGKARRGPGQQILGRAVGAGADLIVDDRHDRRRDGLRVAGEAGQQVQPVGKDVITALAGGDAQGQEPRAPIHLADRHRCHALPQQGLRGLARPQFRLLRRVSVAAYLRGLVGFHRTRGPKPAKAVHVVEKLLRGLCGGVEDGPCGGLGLPSVKLRQVEEQRGTPFGQVCGLEARSQRVGFGIRLLVPFLLRRSGGGPCAIWPDSDQPVPQCFGRNAVEPIVFLDFLEDLGIVALAPCLVGDDRPAGGLDLAGALKTVKMLHILDRVGFLGNGDAAAHHGVEVAEASFPQPPVQPGLADAVPGAQAAQGRDLVGGIVVNMRIRVGRKAGVEQVEEVDQRLFLRSVIMRPEGDEVRAVPDAMQVFQPLDACVGVERIALDVVEEVALGRSGEQVEPLALRRFAQNMMRALRGTVGLQAGLEAQAVERRAGETGHALLLFGEARHGGDPGGLQLGHLAAADPRDKE